MNNNWSTPYKFNGKELDQETGLYYYGARYYIPELSIWGSVDPLADKYPSMSPFMYCAGNPVRLVDPNGMEIGDFISESGKYLGWDGKYDSKLYVIKTSKKSFDSGVKSAGISTDEAQKTEDFISNNSGNTDAFNNNSIAYDNSVEIEGNDYARASMLSIIGNDNGQGGTGDNNNREFGGSLGFFGNVTENQPGDVADPVASLGASIIWNETGKNYKSRFHSHPSGTNFNTTGEQIGFRQAPSQDDILNAGHRTNYVFGRRDDGRTYIYNQSGVVATMPTSSFVIYKR